MEENFIHIPDGKKITAIIEDKTYLFNAIFSLKDYQKVVNELKEEPVGYKNIVAKIVLNHVCNDEMSLLDISKLPDSLLNEYMVEVVKDSERLKAVYDNKQDIVNLYERFILATKENLGAEIDAIKERLSNIQIPQIKIPKAILDVRTWMPNLDSFRETMANISKMVISTQRISETIIDSIWTIIEAHQSFVTQYAGQISKFLSLMTIPSFTEDEIEEMQNALCKWGEYGWVVPDCAPISVFLHEPKDIKEANKIAGKYCTKQYMQSVIDELGNMKGVKKSDLEEAVANYRDKRYKSCAYILFSLIDSKLIRMQSKKQQGKLVNRTVGLRAINKSKEQMLDSDIERTVFLILKLENVYACLSKMFENGNNFIIQPDVLNRNFLDHGMLTRKVTKQDCNKLFLLYYNWLMLMEEL